MKIFIDTNIFYETKYDFVDSSKLKILISYIEKGKIELFLDEIVVSEIKKHIKEKSERIVAIQNKKIQEAEDVFSKTILRSGALSTKFDKIILEQLEKDVLENLKTFLEKSKATIIKNSEVEINLNILMSKYFNMELPFEVKENKKNEFPDAIIIEKIKNYFGNDELHIVSKDKGFRKAFETFTNFKCYEDLDKLFNFITSKEEKYNKIYDILTNKQDATIIGLIKDNIYEQNIQVDGQEWDRKGSFEGYDYEETEILEVSEIEYELDTINTITEDYIEVSFKCSSLIKVMCSYDDYEKAFWDSEEKEYLFLDSISVCEEHDSQFWVYARIPYTTDNDIIEFDYGEIKLELDIKLDKHSRKSRHFSDETDDNYMLDDEDIVINEKCFQCGKIVHGMRFNAYDEEFYCEDCLKSNDDYWAFCEDCGQKKPIDEMAPTGYCKKCESME